jgi:hypothetical protein
VIAPTGGGLGYLLLFGLLLQMALESLAQALIGALWMFPPVETSMRSTPSCLSCLHRLIESSICQPSGIQSVAEMRTKSRGGSCYLFSYLSGSLKEELNSVFKGARHIDLCGGWLGEK